MNGGPSRPRIAVQRPDIVLALGAAYILGGSNYAAIEFALTGVHTHLT